MTIITQTYILETGDIKDIDAKQQRIDEIAFAFANNIARFESPECWPGYCEVIHENTNLCHKLRKKAFLNAYKSQKINGCR